MSQTILIVDDDPDDIEITMRALKKLGRGLEVRSVRSGEEAMRLLEQDGSFPCLIFLDLKMRGMSGIDTTRRIRADKRTRHIPLVMLTNSTLDADMRTACEAGIDCCIHKAFDLDKFGRDLEAQLDRWLE